jgi:hypothetical protein
MGYNLNNTLVKSWILRVLRIRFNMKTHFIVAKIKGFFLEFQNLQFQIKMFIFSLFPAYYTSAPVKRTIS